MIRVRQHKRVWFGSKGFHSGKPVSRVPLTDADHPARQVAIRVIEDVLEPELRHDIDGDEYYDKEDRLAELVASSKSAPEAAKKIAREYEGEYMEATGRDPHFGQFEKKILLNLLRQMKKAGV